MEDKEGKALVKKNRKITKEAILLISIVLIIIILDQALKIWMYNVEDISVVSGFLQFKITKNTNAAYGIGSNSTLTYVVINVVILGIIFKFMTTQNQFVDKKLKIFLSFILAGGISNVIERVIRGYVTEFINIKVINEFLVFNVADIFVMVGWILLAAVFATFTIKEWRNKRLESNLKDEDK